MQGRPGQKARCKIEYCERPTKAKGLCSRHYYRWWKHGDPEKVQKVRRDQDTSPIGHILFRITPEPMSGCWLWEGVVVDGYGQIDVHGKVKYVHRVLYEYYKGEVPEGLELDHLCRVRCCVNPNHLEPVTSKENSRRGLSGINGSMKTHCPYGHSYSEENTYLTPQGYRECRECRRLWRITYEVRNAEA